MTMCRSLALERAPFKVVGKATQRNKGGTAKDDAVSRISRFCPADCTTTAGPCTHMHVRRQPNSQPGKGKWEAYPACQFSSIS